jgi:predicted AlkP superfamily phosphohydrolase/phosphomutase
MGKTILIGIDGATFTVLDHLMEDVPGRGTIMPCLKKLMTGGFRAKLRSTPNPLTPPAWITMLTGKNPGRHGVFDFMRYKDNGDEIFFTLNDFTDIQTETVWSIMSRQNRSVVSLNFPMMAPPPKINGSLAPGFTSWKHLRRNMTPPGLFERMKTILPGFDPKELAWDFKRENEIGQEMDEEYLSEWITTHFPREEQWFNFARTLQTEDDPDFLAVMFDGTDKIQHQAWQFIEPSLTPSHPSSLFLRLRALCLEYFSRLDGYISGLVSAAGPEARVFIASDHGFTVTTEVVRINRYLGELGYLSWREAPETESAKRRMESPFAYLDWKKTQAYCTTPSSNGITIRVSDDPGKPGIPSRDYKSFRARLVEDLHKLKAPDGLPVFTRVTPREEEYSGDHTDRAPDLFLELRDYGFVSIRNLEPVVVNRNYPAGTHHPHGVFIAHGPGIREGKKDDPIGIEDMAALFLYSVDLPVPQDLEGRVPENCFKEGYIKAHPVRLGPPTLPIRHGEVEGSPMTAEETAAMVDQLKMLGYIE